MGDVGVQILLDLLNRAQKNDFKLREAVIGSFEFITMESTLINNVIEQIFKHCADARLETRELCLKVLMSLKETIGGDGSSISYFKAKHILPFYYHFIDDPSPKVRRLAANAILSFGNQA